jgi:hypothetical protein
MYFVGVALVGLAWLVIFSTLAMARKQDEDQDRLEIKLRRENLLALHCEQEACLDSIVGAVKSHISRSR